MNAIRRWLAKYFSKTRYYLAELKENVELSNEYDAAKIETLEKRLNKILRKRMLLGNIRILLWFFIYASIISTVVYVNPVAREVISQVVLLTSIIGVSAFLFLLALTDFLRNKLDEEVILLSAHIIAVYNANDIEQTP